jgi:hypothetical protein
MFAELGIIPSEWAVGGADTEATDIENADSPGNENDAVPADTTPAPADAAAQMLQYPEVQRAMHDMPDEPLAVYRWDGSRGKIVNLPMRNTRRTVHPVAKIMRELAARVEAEQPIAPRVIVHEIKPAPAVEEKPTMRDWMALQLQALAERVKPAEPQPVNVTVNNPAPVAQPNAVEVHNYMDGQSLDAITAQVEAQRLLSDQLLETLKKIQSPTINVEAPVVNVPAPVVNVPAPVVQVRENKPDESNAVMKAIRKLVGK